MPIQLADAAYGRLRNMVLSGQLPAGCSITENGIVDRLVIGKTPVREAMRRLVIEGLLEVTPRLGYTVSPITRADADELYKVREVVECACAELACEALDDGQIDRLVELSDIGFDPNDPESVTAYVGVNLEFHGIIAYGGGNRRLGDLAMTLMQESRRFIQITVLTAELGRAVREQHLVIAEAFRARDRIAVAEACRYHVLDSHRVTVESLDAVHSTV